MGLKACPRGHSLTFPNFKTQNMPLLSTKTTLNVLLDFQATITFASLHLWCVRPHSILKLHCETEPQPPGSGHIHNKQHDSESVTPMTVSRCYAMLFRECHDPALLTATV